MMRIGLEYEFTLIDNDNIYLDFENTKFDTFQKIVEDFPYFEKDDEIFECKSLEKRPKRCYVEGFERYDNNGQLLETTPKGLEVRTLPHASIDAIVEEFDSTFTHLAKIAKNYNFFPISMGYHPYKSSMLFSPSLNQTEVALRTNEMFEIAIKAMMWHSIHVNISISDFSKIQMDDFLQKLNYYAPFIIPFSFSSPFYQGKMFKGLSYRTYVRSQIRKVVQMTNRKGVDVIEFMGFDSFYDMRLLKALLYLIQGLLSDVTLKGRALVQDTDLLVKASLKGFEDDTLKQGGMIVLDAVKAVLKNEGKALEILGDMLLSKDSYARRMKEAYQKTGNIIRSISDQYDRL
ncbi:MAG: hypothetical protein IE909_13845 [Campylobacterales bacterium]|nr:hypothetical protein [Campylobacterales bacterium]